MTQESPPPGILTAETESIEGGAMILRLAGEIDISSSHILTSHFEAIARDRPSGVIIDATGVSFMDSTGLHALVVGKRLGHASGTQIYLVPSRQVRRVLELVFPEPLFAARLDSVEEALSALRAAV